MTTIERSKSTGMFSNWYKGLYPEDWIELDYLNFRLDDCPNCNRSHVVSVEDLHKHEARYFQCGSKIFIIEFEECRWSVADDEYQPVLVRQEINHYDD